MESKLRRYDDDREIPVILEDGTTGSITLGNMHRIVDEHLPRIINEIHDSSPIFRKLLRGK